MSVSRRHLEEALKQSWTRETCFPRIAHLWTPENPAYGQCMPSALVVQDYLGGDLAWCSHRKHYWTIVDGKDVDFTRGQFPPGTEVCKDRIKRRGDLLRIGHVVARYDALKDRVEEYLRAHRKGS